MVRKGPKWSGVVQRWSRVVKTKRGQKGPKRPKVVKRGQEWSKVVRSGQKWSKVIESGQKVPTGSRAAQTEIINSK